MESADGFAEPRARPKKAAYRQRAVRVPLFFSFPFLLRAFCLGLTEMSERLLCLPQHCNPLADSFLAYPRSPDFVDWAAHFPSAFGLAETETLQLNSENCRRLQSAPLPLDFGLWKEERKTWRCVTQPTNILCNTPPSSVRGLCLHEALLESECAWSEFEFGGCEVASCPQLRNETEGLVLEWSFLTSAVDSEAC